MTQVICQYLTLVQLFIAESQSPRTFHTLCLHDETPLILVTKPGWKRWQVEFENKLLKTCQAMKTKAITIEIGSASRNLDSRYLVL